MTNSQSRQELDQSAATLELLADQVGVKCADCATVLHSRAAIGLISYMAPLGSDDYQARAYCDDCADAMRLDCEAP